MSESNHGQCFCGAVEFTVTGTPNMMGYCHCTDCAEWAGAPINAFSLWPKDNVAITAGVDQIGSYARTDASHRKFCKACGGHLMTDHPGMSMVDVYLNNVPGVKHQGAMHIYYGERSMDVPDGLPKYADMPKDFGGSGDMIAD